MGLLTSVNNVAYELQDTKRQKEAEKLQKENKKIHQNNLKKKLQQTFYMQLKYNRDNLENELLRLGQIETREQIIYEISQKIKDKTEFDMTYLNEIYTKELQAMARTFKPTQDYQKKQQQKEEQQEEKQKQNVSISIGSIIGGIALTIGIIIFLPLLFILFVISAAMKTI